MFVVFYDPLRLLSRYAIVAWFEQRFGRIPQRMYAPGDFGLAWAWWHVGFVTPAEGEMLPRLPTPPGENPYRDPANDVDSPLFREILRFSPKTTFLPVVLRG